MISRSSIEDWIRKKGKDDSGLGAIITLTYKVLSSPVSTNILNLIFTVIIIPIAITHVDKNYIEYKDLLSSREFMLTCLIYIILLALSAWAINYSQRYRKNHKAFQKISRAISHCYSHWADQTSDLISEVSKNATLANFKSMYHRHSRLQDRAMLLCNILFDHVERSFKLKNHQVTVMHKLNDEKGTYIKMIAFQNSDKETPGSFKEKYYLNDDFGKKHYHVNAFINEKRGIQILKDRVEIEKVFHPNPKSQHREDRLKQYIGIPIFDKEGEMISLVQLDCQRDGGFGETRGDIEYIARGVFAPICSIITVWYHKQELAALVNRIN